MIDEVHRYFTNNSERQGIATLAFEITGDGIDSLHQKYLRHHPHLIAENFHDEVMTYQADGSLDCTKIFEVYAYYKNEKKDLHVDRATKLRFIQQNFSTKGFDKTHEINATIYRCPLPGLVPVEATFDSTCMVAYFDHWVSNGTLIFMY